ncbi:WD40 repeat-containing protein [Cavenderia fasciculata]|uniref:WD40 repeat-containing protein n=1 Tax=Cavenderia fasciculata TaxID=261658 RepID=F4PS49_CACFS|nr:WD40 repeat-containing protein [Cavenderia fasciculata]EGG21432.1 WD40 repeat-containing protein [Cavenderia fasciculata]|eukprot:XP_004359282.1 WD40 repeat-containing protein [Cavenderia fasciculata]
MENKDVVVMMCNYGFRDMTLNLIKSISQQDRDDSTAIIRPVDWNSKYLLFALDDKSHQFFRRNNIPSINFKRQTINLCFQHCQPFTSYCTECNRSVCATCGDHNQHSTNVVVSSETTSSSNLGDQYNQIGENEEINQTQKPLETNNNEGVYGEESESYGGVGFRAICNEKPLVVLDVLKRGYNVLWTDTDIVWMADPLKYILQLDLSFNGLSDLIIQQDDDDVCAGFYYIKSNPKTIKYMETVISFLNPVVDDQIAMRLFLKGNAINLQQHPDTKDKDQIKYLKLDRALFPNGTAYFNLKLSHRRNVSPIIIHNNCIIGHRSKKDRFIDYNLWFVKDYQVDYKEIFKLPPKKEKDGSKEKEQEEEEIVHNPKPIKIFKAHFDIVTCVSSFNNFLFSTSIDKSIKIWDLNEGKLLKSKYIHKRGAVWGLIITNQIGQRDIESMSSSYKIITASHDKTVQIWDDKFNSIQTFGGHYEVINCIQLVDGGNDHPTYLITGSDDHTIRVCSVTDSTFKRVFLGHSGWVSSLAFHNNVLYSSSSDESIRCWDFTSGRCQNIIRAQQGWVRSIILSQDNSRLISGGNDGSIKFWNLATNECERTIDLVTDKSSVSNLLLFNNVLYATFDNGSLQCFNAFNGEYITEYEGHPGVPINTLYLHNDINNPLIITGAFDKLIKSWKPITIVAANQ